ncbi:hypothetical protein DFH09DRAFT_1324937 [Mycena vulgaris]|nr:hypothetical protein DFH09DRAFT_1324937 [Mycena vulgaris]
MAPFAPLISNDDFDHDENMRTLRRCQRRIVELEAEAEKEKDTPKPVSLLKAFLNLGRCIPKVVSPFASIDSLIAESDRREDLEQARNASDEVQEEEEEHTTEQKRLYNGYKELIRFIPALKKPLAEDEYDDVVLLLNALRQGARNARSDDTKNVKTAIVPWLQRLFPEMEALDPDSRDERGIYNDWIGSLLCPTEYSWVDEDIRTKIREGDVEYLISANSFWNGLYPHNEFDSENPDVGLFRNVMLLMVWKYMFTSPVSVKTTMAAERENVRAPTSATPLSTSTAPLPRPAKKKSEKKGSPSTKRSVASLIGLKRVTGRSIAYAAVQYRVALSDVHHWEERDGSFDYVQFYNSVVDYFEFPPGPLAKREVDLLLDWWNTNTFGHTPTWSLYEGGAPGTLSSVQRLHAIRSAREVGLTIVPTE